VDEPVRIVQVYREQTIERRMICSVCLCRSSLPPGRACLMCASCCLQELRIAADGFEKEKEFYYSKLRESLPRPILHYAACIGCRTGSGAAAPRGRGGIAS
jgi:hypothetical protein